MVTFLERLNTHVPLPTDFGPQFELEYLLGEGASGIVDVTDRGEVLARYVRWLGDEVRARVGSDRVRTIVLTDRGRAGEEGDEGLLFVAGPAVDPACVGPTIDALEVLPALLRLLHYYASGEVAWRTHSGSDLTR